MDHSSFTKDMEMRGIEGSSVEEMFVGGSGDAISFMEEEVRCIGDLGNAFSDQEVFDRVRDMDKARQALVRLYLLSIDFSTRKFCSWVARAVYSKVIPN